MAHRSICLHYTKASFHIGSAPIFTFNPRPKMKLGKLCASLLFGIVLCSASILLVRSLGIHSIQQLCSQALTPPQPSLNVVTLIYSTPYDHINIAHNCHLISSTSHKFFIHTDDISQPYCKLCTCIPFKLFNCPCPTGKNGCIAKNPCQKLQFIRESVTKYQELLLLDSDLIIMKPQFLDRLKIRSEAHDFLATYGHMSVSKQNYSNDYRRNFNSGLMFMRRLPHVNYNGLLTLLYARNNTERDQGIVSSFIHKNYENWDTLSWKWHCRSLKLYNQNIPPAQCYTIHDRGEVRALLKKLGTKRRTIH